MTAPHRWSAYFTPTHELDGIGLHCLGAGGQDGHVPAVRDRRFDHYAAVLVERGAGWVEGSGTRHDVGPGEVLWIPPGERHSYGPDADGWSETWVLFDGPAMTAYEWAGITGKDLRPRYAGPATQGVFARLHGLTRRPGPQSDALLGAAVHRLVSTMSSGPAPAREPGLEEESLRVLREAAGTGAGVRELAASVGISTAQFRRRIHRATGMSPQRYLTLLRLSRAKYLLAETHLYVAEVAARVGYVDPAYFTRVFTRHVGAPPQAFRELYRRTPGASPPLGPDR